MLTLNFTVDIFAQFFVGGIGARRNTFFFDNCDKQRKNFLPFLQAI
jgi:hypothetical protein